MPDFKELKNKIKHGDFQFVYDELKKSDFEYTLENIEKEFSSVDNRDMFCYLLYLISNENTPKHTILLCNYLMYSGTFFYNRETVIRYLLDNCLVKNGNDIKNTAPASIIGVNIAIKLIPKNIRNAGTISIITAADIKTLVNSFSVFFCLISAHFASICGAKARIRISAFSIKSFLLV